MSTSSELFLSKGRAGICEAKFVHVLKKTILGSSVNSSICSRLCISFLPATLEPLLLSEGRLLEGQIELEKLKAQVTRGTEDEKTVALKQKQLDMMKIENKLVIANENLKKLNEKYEILDDIRATYNQEFGYQNVSRHL